MKIGFSRWILAVFFAIAASGCGNNDNDLPERDGRTYLRLFNGVSDADGVDLILDGERLYNRLPYLSDTGYFRTDSEDRELTVVVTGTFTPLFSSTTTLNDNSDQTLLVFGTSDDPRGIIVNDDNEQPGGDVSKLRIIDLAQAVRSIDVYIVAVGRSIDNVAPTVSSLSSGAISPYIVSDDGTYDVIVTPRGEKSPLASKRHVFAGDAVSSIVVADTPDGDGAVSILVLRDR
jgi:hypothetical protein